MQLSPTREIELDKIRIDGGTQARAEIDQDVVEQYAEDINQLPPAIVFIDGANFWLVDGFHRYFAHLKAGKKTIACTCRAGTQRDAVLASLQQNASHGLRRSPVDKRKSVNIVLADKEWMIWSDREIADHCHVSHTFVANIRKEGKSKGGNVATPEPRQETKNAVIPAEVQKQVEAIIEAGGAPRLMKQGEKTVAFNADKKAPAANQHTKAKAEEPVDPEKPWGAFESQMRDIQARLRSLGRELGATLGYDANAKRLTSKWAHYYSHAGTIGAINQLVRVIEDGLPAELASQSPGYVSNQRRDAIAASAAKVA